VGLFDFAFSKKSRPVAGDPNQAASGRSGPSASAFEGMLTRAGIDRGQQGVFRTMFGSRVGKPAGPAVQNDFKGFRSGQSNAKYPVSVQPITIVRPIDKASPVLLRKCIETETFISVSVVKRKAAGTAFAGEPYLRMDFVGVMIKDVSWSNDEPVKETTRLISRSIVIRYRPQASNGKLYPPVIGSWSMRVQTSGTGTA